MKDLTNEIPSRITIEKACARLFELFVQGDESVYMIFNGVVVQLHWDNERSISKR